MIDMGLSPMDAVPAATRNGAEALGMLDRLGTVEPGKLADVIALDGDRGCAQARRLCREGRGTLQVILRQSRQGAGQRGAWP